MENKLTAMQKYLSNPENVKRKKESDKKAYDKYLSNPANKERRSKLDSERYQRNKSTGNQNFY